MRVFLEEVKWDWERSGIRKWKCEFFLRGNRNKFFEGKQKIICARGTIQSQWVMALGVPLTEVKP